MKPEHNLRNNFTQTGNNEVENEQNDNFNQTDTIVTNTEALTYDDVLKIDSNGKIHLNEREILLDVRVGHKPNTWEEIETMFQGKLKLKMLRRTWISNNGNLFKTTIGNWQ